MRGEVRYLQNSEKGIKENRLKENHFRETESSEKLFEKREIKRPECITSNEITTQDIAEAAHKHTKEAMILEFGQYMSKEQIECLKSDQTKEKLHVITGAEYVEKFPDIDFDVAGHCDREGNIYIKDISPAAVEHIAVHETMHLCANREVIKEEEGTCKTVSGMRETLDYPDGTSRDLNRGINEGATEAYALRELQRRGETEAFGSINAYSEARMWFERMEDLVGSDKMAAAYFGKEKEGLATEFQRLNNGDEKAWERFSSDVDVLLSETDSILREKANERLIDQYCTMVFNK